jgi:hypothetical protein
MRIRHLGVARALHHRRAKELVMKTIARVCAFLAIGGLAATASANFGNMTNYYGNRGGGYDTYFGGGSSRRSQPEAPVIKKVAKKAGKRSLKKGTRPSSGGGSGEIFGDLNRRAGGNI